MAKRPLFSKKDFAKIKIEIQIAIFAPMLADKLKPPVQPIEIDITVGDSSKYTIAVGSDHKVVLNESYDGPLNQMCSEVVIPRMEEILREQGVLNEDERLNVIEDGQSVMYESVFLDSISIMEIQPSEYSQLQPGIYFDLSENNPNLKGIINMASTDSVVTTCGFGFTNLEQDSKEKILNYVLANNQYLYNSIINVNLSEENKQDK